MYNIYEALGGITIIAHVYLWSNLSEHGCRLTLPYPLLSFDDVCDPSEIGKIMVQYRTTRVTPEYFWECPLKFCQGVPRYLFSAIVHNGECAHSWLSALHHFSIQLNKREAFKEFEEGRIIFPPTFKYDPGTDHYDSSSKQRVPSFTDRILYRCSRGGINCIRYDSLPLFRTSDHKPVWGVFTCKIRPGKDDVPLAAGLFNRDVYLEALKRRRRHFTGSSSRGCPVQ
ncbi:unnamed protein product, partial [Meganyctiphanes norvegica]